MSSFTEPLAYESTDIFRGGHRRTRLVGAEELLELSGARRLFRVQRGFTYHCDRARRVIDIPAGFTCDLGSIPAFARIWLSPDDPWAQAYALHDWLYRYKIVDRLTSDLIMWDAMGLPFRAYDEAGNLYRVVCPTLARAAVYRSVRVGGRYR